MEISKLIEFGINPKLYQKPSPLLEPNISSPSKLQSDWNESTHTESDWNQSTNLESDWNKSTNLESDCNISTNLESDWNQSSHLELAHIEPTHQESKHHQPIHIQPVENVQSTEDQNQAQTLSSTPPPRKRRKLKKESSPTNDGLESKKHRYNLREQKKIRHVRRYTQSCRRGLVPVIPSQYHPFKTEDEEKLIDVTKITRPEQIESYEDENGEYIMLSWLTTTRIFRYTNTNEKGYIEIKRIPNRYIDISPNIITCLHHCDGKYYIAYMWSKNDRRPYVEIRDNDGNLVGDPLKLDGGNTVSSIYSDQDYIYIRTTSGLLYIHRKDFFGTIFYLVDFNHDFGCTTIKTWVDQPEFNSYTRLPLVSATRNEILVTLYDVLDHSPIHCYRFEDSCKIVSMIKVDRLYIIHRRSNNKSIIDFGYLGRTHRDDENFVFIHESKLEFTDSSDIIQMKVSKEYLYIYGSTELLNGLKNFEIGCIYIPSITPLWTKRLSERDNHGHIIPHSSGICFINGCQKISRVPKITNLDHHCHKCGFSLPSKEELVKHEDNYGHKSILSEITVLTNKFLQDCGSSIFKKLYLIE